MLAGFVVGFGLVSWAIASVYAGVWTGALWVERRGVPAWAILLSPLVLVAALGLVGRVRRTPHARSAGAPRAYFDDDSWYASDWRQDPANAAHDLGTAGYPLELLGGPLAGRTARLRDSRFRLWVAAPAVGGDLIVRGGKARPDLQGVTLLGSYGFSHGDEAMIWTPLPEASASA